MMNYFISFLLSIALFVEPNSLAAKKNLTHKEALRTFSTTIEQIEEKRLSLRKRYKEAKRHPQKEAIRQEARAYIVETMVNKIAPAWLGMEWTMAAIPDGLKPNARIPHEKGKGVSCSWFVVSVLENAGLRLGNPRGFAGTIAVHLQRSLTPNKKDMKRFFHISPSQLHDRFVKLGDGIYIIGLNCHVGFVHVKGQQVTFIHSNYAGPTEVMMEPLRASLAIEMSQDTGYVVTPLFQDTRLVDHWITGRKLFFNGPRK